MLTGVISEVTPDSLAERVGLQVGDELLSINGRPVRDVIDVQFYAADENLSLNIRRQGREIVVRANRRYNEPLGMLFAQPTFDGLRRCDNRCEFCFVTQMPAGLRRSLYVKDDDYRHSFLFGNYITLTNVTESDWRRIEEQHLSPLYVSVHATDSDLRRQVLRNPAAPDILPQLRRLADVGVEVHTQIVVVPGLNDGLQLERSIGDLTELYPAVRSVSVVPVGLTKYHRGKCRVHTADEARQVFQQVTEWQARLRQRLGVGFVYLSDEWYLRLGENVPPLEAYDGLDLTENGMGLVRRFLSSSCWVSEFQTGANRGAETGEYRTITLVTGILFAPVLRSIVPDSSVEIVSVVNHFFGETVTVAGLLTGQDVVAQLRGRDLGDVVVLPPAMFGGPERQSLDEMWIEEIEDVLGLEVTTGLALVGNAEAVEWRKASGRGET